MIVHVVCACAHVCMAEVRKQQQRAAKAHLSSQIDNIPTRLPAASTSERYWCVCVCVCVCSKHEFGILLIK